MKECTWKYIVISEKNKYYNTNCGHTWFTEEDELEFRFKYCPYCGKKLKLSFK